MTQQINLFNPVFLQQKKIFSARTMAVALAGLALGVAALYGYGSTRVAAMQQQADAGAAQLKKTEARLAMVKSEFAPRRKDPAVALELAEADRQLAALGHVSGVLERRELGNTRGHAEVFRALARQHVDGLWLTGVNVGPDAAITVRGRALDAAQVPGYLQRLRREPLMQGKTFGGMQIAGAASAAQPWIEFSLSSTAEAPKP